MTFLGNKENLKTSTGELEPGRLPMEKHELESSFCWEITLWGECLLDRGNQELGLYANLLGKWGKTEWFLLGIDSFEFAGEEGLEHSSSARDMYFRVFGLHWGSGVRRLNSDGNSET